MWASQMVVYVRGRGQEHLELGIVHVGQGHGLRDWVVPESVWDVLGGVFVKFRPLGVVKAVSNDLDLGDD